MQMSESSDRPDMPEGMSVVWSPDLDRYLAGENPGTIRCAICKNAPCECPAFGSDEYIALLDKAHGRRESAVCPYCRQTFYALPMCDPLRKHFDYCPANPDSDTYGML